MRDEPLSTNGLLKKDRLPFWRDKVCATFVELDCELVNSDDFFGSISNSVIGDIQFSLINASSQLVSRTRSKIAQSSRDYFLLSLQTRGDAVVQQDGRTAILKPGDFALYDTTRPYDLHFNHAFSQLVLRLPRAVVAGRLADAERCTALRIAGRAGAGRLASIFIRQLHREIDGIDPISAARLHASTVDLLATALAEQGGTTGIGCESHLLLRRRIMAFIDDHFADPGLTCAAIAGAHGISDRHVRTIFENSPLGVAEMIWARRLDQAKRDLADPLLTHIGITAIGFDVGFKDAAHFSRSFKAKFGLSPRDYRADAALTRRGTLK
jgi:AraC-like DNA-binding protein